MVEFFSLSSSSSSDLDANVSTEIDRFSFYLSIFNVIAIGVMILSIGWVWKFQVDVLAKNTTSMEQSARKWQGVDARELKKPYNWPYDYGNWIENYKAVLGNSFLLWPLPTKPESDGFSWRAKVYNQGGDLVEEIY